MRCKSIAGLGALALLAVVTAGGSFARAENGVQADQYAKRMFAGKFAAQGKSYACFARRYDAAHLAKHPQQNVSAMRMLVEAELVPEDTKLSYNFAVGVNFRDKPGNFTNEGGCGYPEVSQVSADKLQLECNVSCDGRSLTVELTKADKSILVRVEGLSLGSEKHPDAGIGDGDDRVFRLDRVDLDECKSLMKDGNTDNEKPATM